jgi:hypothetical protein
MNGRMRGRASARAPGLRQRDGLSCRYHTFPSQWEHTPLISITGDLGVNPAERAAALSFETTSTDDASPTVPQ